MTITQLKIVLSTAKHGSISGAAKELGIPQPNASSGIKTIEKELGFDIYNRARGGISLTEKGKLFLEHAQRIVDETEKIDQMGKMERVFQLRVGCTNYYRGREAFINLCARHKDEEIADLQYYNVSFEKGFELLAEHKIDLFLGVIIESLKPSIIEMAKDKHLSTIELDDTELVLTLSKNHPLVQKNLLENGVDSCLLEDYPYIAYHSLNEDFESAYYKAALPIPCKYTIFIEEKETRFKLVRDTNAFMLGAWQPQETLDFFNLVQYNYHNLKGTTLCMYRDLDENREEVKEFIELI